MKAYSSKIYELWAVTPALTYQRLWLDGFILMNGCTHFSSKAVGCNLGQQQHIQPVTAPREQTGRH